MCREGARKQRLQQFKTTRNHANQREWLHFAQCVIAEAHSPTLPPKALDGSLGSYLLMH
jgi:hypothetical protein